MAAQDSDILSVGVLSTMKLMPLLLLVALPVLVSGCMTEYCLDRAQGRAGKKVIVNEYRDRVVRNDGTNCVLERRAPSGATNEIRLHLVTRDAGYEPKPAYYALVPLTVAPDVVTFPFQLFYFFPATASLLSDD